MVFSARSGEARPETLVICRVGHNHTFIGIYTVYIRHFWQGDQHTYGHIRCVYTVFMVGCQNPTHD